MQTTYYSAVQLADVSADFTEALRKIIPSDLHYDNEDSHSQGLETDRHATTFYANSDFTEISLNDIFKYVENVDITENTIVKSLSFEVFDTNPKYDVLVCKVQSNELTKLNDLLKKRFGFYNVKPTFDDYKPHVTLAYLRKGTAKSYMDEFTSTMNLPEFEIKAIKVQRTDKYESGVVSKVNYVIPV